MNERKIAKAERPIVMKKSKPRSKENTAPWSATVSRTSDALDLEPEVFRKRTAGDVACSLKQSAEQSRRRKAEPFRSAMSMLTFTINRAGRNLPESRRRLLERAKGELRKAFGRA